LTDKVQKEVRLMARYELQKNWIKEIAQAKGKVELVEAFIKKVKLI